MLKIRTLLLKCFENHWSSEGVRNEGSSTVVMKKSYCKRELGVGGRGVIDRMTWKSALWHEQLRHLKDMCQNSGRHSSTLD